MACGIAVAALVFSIITLIFEILGVIFCLLSLLFPEKTAGLTFSKWFIVTHIGVYAGTLIFYVFHFFIKMYTYDDKTYGPNTGSGDADAWKNWKRWDYCYFGIPNSEKGNYPDGNGYTVYWGHIFLFIVGIVGIIISILYLLPVGIKVFGLLYVIVGFIHIFIVWVVFLSVSVPSMGGAHTPGSINYYYQYNSWNYTSMCIEYKLKCGATCWCPYDSGSYYYPFQTLCTPVPTKFTWGSIDADRAFHGCDNGQEISNTRNYNFLFVISQKAIEANLYQYTTWGMFSWGESLNNEYVEFHANNYHPWFFTYELVFFIMMSVFYIGFVLVNFNIDFRGTFRV